MKLRLNKICLLLILLEFMALRGKADYAKDIYPAEIIAEGRMEIQDLVKKYNYPLEVHDVMTEDKYILRMHRLPRNGAKPIFLMHGLLDSSLTWILFGPWSGLGYYLYDMGYDVWLGNARGNRYSRNHTNHNPDDNEDFWKFSFHEIGYYDLPAMIDYVLQKTNHKKLTYFGHSQGTTSFFIMCSMRPQYNDKISSMHALAPVAFMKHLKTPLAALLRNVLQTTSLDLKEILPHSDVLYDECLKSKKTEDNCLDIFFQLMGKETKEFNKTMLPVLFLQLPAGCSFYQVRHYMQLIESDRFCQYDHGSAKNIKLYGNTHPPDYPLQEVRAPVALYYTENDNLSHEVDVKRLVKLLTNVIKDHLYPYKEWNHITVMWGINARKLAHADMLELVKKYE